MTAFPSSLLAGCTRACVAFALALLVVLVGAAVPAADHTPDEAAQPALEEAVRAFRMGDYEAALARFGPLAEDGVAEAQYYLGFMHDQGLGLPRDPAAAAAWYQRAAGLGHAEAQNHLGLLYFEGSGVPRSFRDAFIYFELAAAAGNKDAANNRLIVARKMTSAQITAAQKAAGEFLASQRAEDEAVPRPTRSAAGVVVTGGGLVLTLAEAVEGCAEPTLRSAGAPPAAATVVAADDFNRLVLLGGLDPRRAVRLSDGPLEAGAAVTMVAPGADDAAPEVIEAAVLRDAALARVDQRYLQLDRPLGDAPLGTPVFDSAGRLAGLAVPGLDVRAVALVVGEPTAAAFALRADLAGMLLEINGYRYDAGLADLLPVAGGLDSRLRAATVAVECWREDESWPEPRQAAGSSAVRRTGGRRRVRSRDRARRSSATCGAASKRWAASCRCSTATARRSRRAPSGAASARAGRSPGSPTRSSPTGWSAA